jgi:hypothetical protein
LRLGGERGLERVGTRCELGGPPGGDGSGGGFAGPFAHASSSAAKGAAIVCEMRTLIAASIAALFAAEAAAAFVVEGRIAQPDGSAVVGAFVTLRRGDPIQLTTVFSDAEGVFCSPELRSLQRRACCACAASA